MVNTDIWKDKRVFYSRNLNKKKLVQNYNSHCIITFNSKLYFMIINLTIRYYIIVIIFCIKLLFYIWFSTFSKATISQTGISVFSLLLELFSKTKATGKTSCVLVLYDLLFSFGKFCCNVFTVICYL